MKMLVGTLALAVAFALPAFGPGSGTAQGQTVQGKTAAKAKTTKRPVAPRIRQVQPVSPYAHHPSYDVYVNGEYAGSDPDPRIRWSLRREYCEQRVDGC